MPLKRQGLKGQERGEITERERFCESGREDGEEEGSGSTVRAGTRRGTKTGTPGTAQSLEQQNFFSKEYLITDLV